MMRISRADEVLDPDKAEAYRKKVQARTEARLSVYKAVTRGLLKNEDFVQWLNTTIQSFGYWRTPHRELAPFEQGRRAAVHEIVECLLANGGEEAEAWYASAAEDFAKWIQNERQQ